MENWEQNPIPYIAFAAIFVCCVIGIVLQFYAWRHLKPGIPRFGHKDSLFKKKDEYYTEEGMKYVNMQKTVTYVMAALFAVALFSSTPGSDVPDANEPAPEAPVE